MNSLGSYIYTFGRYRKVNPKNGLGELLVFLILTTLHFEKDLSLLHSAKCSVSTQLTYIQKIIQFNKGAISTIKGFTKQSLKSTKIPFYTWNMFSILEYFVISWNFWSLGYLATLVFSPLLVPICKFLQNQYRFV